MNSVIQDLKTITQENTSIIESKLTLHKQFLKDIDKKINQAELELLKLKNSKQDSIDKINGLTNPILLLLNRCFNNSSGVLSKLCLEYAFINHCYLHGTCYNMNRCFNCDVEVSRQNPEISGEYILNGQVEYQIQHPFWIIKPIDPLDKVMMERFNREKKELKVYQGSGICCYDKQTHCNLKLMYSFNYCKGCREDKESPICDNCGVKFTLKQISFLGYLV